MKRLTKLKIISFLKTKLLQGFVIYLGSSVLNKAIPFLLLPILTRYLSTEEYGTLAIFQVLISFGVPLVGMNMHTNIDRRFFSKSKDYLSVLICNMLYILIFTSSLSLIFISVYLLLGGTTFSIPDRWLYSLPVIAFMNMMNTINLTLIRNQKKPFVYGSFEISRTILDLSISIILIILYSYGWEGRANGILFATLTIGSISFLRIWKSGYIKHNINLETVKEILLVSIPLIPHKLGLAIITLSDRLFIDQMLNTSAVGIYDVGYQFGLITSVIVTAFSLTWSPWVYEKLASIEYLEKVKIVKATYLVAGVFILLAIGVYLISLVLLPIMTEKEFHGGLKYVIWVALGYSFHGMYTLVFPYGVHVGKTSYLGITTLFATIINLFGNYYLIQLNGAVGAAQATLVSYIFMFTIVWWYSNKLYPMPWIKGIIKSDIP